MPPGGPGETKRAAANPGAAGPGKIPGCPREKNWEKGPDRFPWRGKGERGPPRAWGGFGGKTRREKGGQWTWAPKPGKNPKKGTPRALWPPGGKKKGGGVVAAGGVLRKFWGKGKKKKGPQKRGEGGRARGKGARGDGGKGGLINRIRGEFRQETWLGRRGVGGNPLEGPPGGGKPGPTLGAPGTKKGPPF